MKGIKTFHNYFRSKRKYKENEVLLFGGAGEVVEKDREKTQVLNALQPLPPLSPFSPSPILQPSLNMHDPRSLGPLVVEDEQSLELEKDHVDPVTLIQVKSVLNENKIVKYYIRKGMAY